MRKRPCLGDEVVRPERTIPKAIVFSVLIVATLYVLLQLGVLGVVPWQSLLDPHGRPTTQAQYVGAFVMERTWGRTAAVLVTLLVLVTAFASLYGNLLGFSRISFAAARDGAFLPIFAKLHPRKDFPHIALLAVGTLSLFACLFTLDEVIAFLTAGIVLIQGIAQIAALSVLRAQRASGPFKMPLYPLPALVALAGWSLAFAATGPGAIALGLGWLLCGSVVYLVAARMQRWWPFVLATILALAVPAAARADALRGWSNWNVARIVSENAYPVFEVDGRPFFVFGAAFFYERIPRDRWYSALLAYKRLGINTIDLYLIWNWHASPGSAGSWQTVRYDFTGRGDPRRDLLGLLKLTHQLGFRLILRPGPVIRNEWRNGGYPPWLLRRAEYDMPLRDVLEGQYPATATLQNANADAAAAEWLANATHRRYASAWLRAVLDAVAPYARDTIAIALDDDQGAYLDNDTWPAPHWRAYVEWLRSTVRSVVGPRVPLFVNTYEMKVAAASPVWAWGNWYQTDAYRIGVHDLADLDFATGLLQTQSQRPLMQAEFQAGWFQAAQDAVPRPSDPSNTTLALHELLRDGMHGVVTFPAQDTIYPAGWEVPWANWSYAWDAALTADLHASQRYAPTREFGELIRRYGPLLARTHVAADAAIIWPPSLFRPSMLNNGDFAAFADATIATQRECNARGIACTLIDLGYIDRLTLQQHPALLLPMVLSPKLRSKLEPWARERLAELRSDGRLRRDASSVKFEGSTRMVPDSTLLVADDGSYGFVDALNPSGSARTVGPFRVGLRHGSVTLAAVRLAGHSARLIPVGVHVPEAPAYPQPSRGDPPPFVDGSAKVLRTQHLRVAFAPQAGARISELDAGSGNVATTIGLLRDAIDPEPSPSTRDYISAYTHPLPAGTFNRPYDCATAVAPASSFRCRYDAPDIPAGGARFERRLAVQQNQLLVTEQFEPRDATSTARLVSISGFAFLPGDLTIASSDGETLGILHGTRLAWLRCRHGDVARIDVRQTRGAQLVTLVFARRTVELRLGIYSAFDPSEARRFIDAKEP